MNTQHFSVTDTPQPNEEFSADKLEKQVAVFLRKGGAITQLPSGVMRGDLSGRAHLDARADQAFADREVLSLKKRKQEWKEGA